MGVLIKIVPMAIPSLRVGYINNEVRLPARSQKVRLNKWSGETLPGGEMAKYVHYLPHYCW